MKNIIEMPDSIVVAEIGKYIKHHRLRQNMTQERLALESGVKRLTLSNVENGKVFSTLTFVKLLRALDLLEGIMGSFVIPNIISPSLYIKMQKNSRKRARTASIEQETETSTNTIKND